ncbi:MAG: hypothetical protein ABI960_07940, partial [Candidatus Eisenbacteria bacterium]
MRQLRPLSLAVALVVLPGVVLPPTVRSSPTVDLHWNSCTSTLMNLDGGQGSTPKLVVTAHGLTGTIRGYYLGIRFWSLGALLPQAWRFDSEGCAAGLLTGGAVSSNAACPRLGGYPSPTTYQYQYLGEGVSRGWLGFSSQFPAFVADPATTYTLAEFNFDFGGTFNGAGSRADSCGCLDRPLCLALTDHEWFDGDLQPRSMASIRDALTWNDPTNTNVCPIGP